MVGFLEQVRLAFSVVNALFRFMCAFMLRVWQVAAVYHNLYDASCMWMQFIWRHSCCCTTSPGGCKRWVWCSLVTTIYLFHIQLLCTHMFRVYVLMFVLEGELKSHAYAFVSMYVWAVNLVMVHHEWFMIVTWLCIMFVDLSLGRSICFKWVSTCVKVVLTTMLCWSCFSTFV